MMEKKPAVKKQAAYNIQLVLLVIVVFAAGVIFGSQSSISFAQNERIQLPPEAEAAFEPLYETYNLIERQYIDEVELTDLVDGAIRGMVEALDDTYSNYVDAESYPFISDDLAGEIEGIGATVTENEEEEVEIVNVLKGTPAEAAGLQAGDVFVEVNGEEALGWTYLELVSKVRGPSGTTVELLMRRGEELLEFSVQRARIEIPNVETDILEGNVGYISMVQFSSNAREQMDEAFTELDVNSLNGLIYDLRGNPGGLLSTATQIAGLFLDNDVILIEEFGDGETRTFTLRDDEVIEIFDDGTERLYARNAGNAGITVPVVVLIDETSASASELVAGAWQDNNTVTLLGETSFGKGTVQVQNSLINGGGVRLTVARWLTPSGNWITDIGVTPDIIVEIADDAELEDDEDPQLEAALEFILSQQAETVDTE